MKKINIVLVLLTLVGCASPALPTGDNQITIAQMQATQTTNTGELTPTILPTDAKTPKSSSTAPTATPTDIPPFIEDFERDLGGQLDLTRWVIVPVNNAEYTINQSEGYLRLFVSGDPIVDWGGVSLVLKPFQGVPLNHIGVFEAKLLISSDRVSDSASTQIKIVVDDQMDGTYQAVWCGVNAWNDSQPRIECGVEDTKNDVYSVEGYHSASIVYDEWHTLRIEIDYQTPEFFFFFDDEFWGSHIPTASVWSEPETRVNLDIWVGRNTGASATSYVDDVFIRSTPEFTYTTTGLGPIGPKGTTEATTPTVIRVPRDYPTIQRAIFATRDGDTVLVAAGTYYENLNYLGKDITVTSEAGPDATIIDGSQRGSVVTFERGESGAAVLEGFTIMNGLASFEFAFGGGISIRDASPTITNNVITRNGAFVGGGIYIQGNGASPIIKENVISNNIAPERGGGVAIWDGSTPVLQENVIADNLAMEGAGIEIANHSSPIIDGNTIENNWAGADLDWSLHAEQHLNGIDIKVGAEEGPNFGAGILVVNHSSPTIENNEITGNYGGGIAVIWNSSPTIKNNTISNNRGEVLGGGIFIALGSSPQISENQISGNRALWGGGIQVFRDSSPRIQNNTIKNNRAEIEGGGIYVWEHSNPIVVENTIEGNQAPIGGAIWLDRTSSILSAKEDSLDLGDLESAIISEAGNLLSGSVFRQPPSPSSGEPVSNKTILVPIEYSSIQAAINAAEHGDTVIVSPGTYRENINFNGKDITLRSENPDDSEIVEATIIEARVPSPVITFMSGETAGAVLEGFTIQNGLGGGAIYIQSSNPVVKGNVIRDSVGDRGRGISCIRGCSATIKNNVIQNNTAELGAGIYCNLSSPTIENNVITNNHAPNGAGLFLWFSSPLILDNTINQNVKIEGMARHSSGGGLFVDHFSMATIKGNIIRGNNPGGIYIDSSSPIVDSNIIIENQAEIGSGLSLYLDASPDIRNNIIADNVSSYGVISVIFSFPKITNNTVISNTTDYRCPGIALTTKSTAVITNTIIWQDGDNICVEQNSEVVVTNSIVMLGWPGEGNISQNPLFEGDGDYHLQSSSPGIDAGIDVGVYSDIDGDTRPQGEGYDIGADEYTSDK